MKAITLFLIGCAVGIAIAPTNAHTPCEEQTCEWEVVINTITAELEEVYVCK